MFPQQLDLRDRDSIYEGLSVKIITDEGQEVIGVIGQILTLTKFDFKGVYVELKTGQRGHAIEVIESESERDVRRLIAKFYSDTKSDIDEGDYLEFKETFAFNKSRSDNEQDKTIMKPTWQRWHVFEVLEANGIECDQVALVDVDITKHKKININSI